MKIPTTLLWSMVLAANAQQITFTPQPGRDYWVQTNSTLQSRYWVDIKSVLAGGSADPITAALPTSAAGNGFMRVLCADAPTFWWDWQRRGLETFTLWGLGTNETKYVHNDVPIDWYEDQYDTGWCAEINCAPTAAAMAVNWWHRKTVTSGQQARAAVPKAGNPWSTGDILVYIRNQGATSRYIDFYTHGAIWQMTNLLDHGGIAVMAIFMTNVTNYTADPVLRVHKFYYGATGSHAVVLKGYRETDTGKWFEFYDPASMRWEYADGTRMGLNRAYSEIDMVAATRGWSYLIAIDAPGTPQPLASAEPPAIQVR